MDKPKNIQISRPAETNQTQQNIICAMLALLKELDTDELEMVKREITVR